MVRAVGARAITKLQWHGMQQTVPALHHTAVVNHSRARPGPSCCRPVSVRSGKIVTPRAITSRSLLTACLPYCGMPADTAPTQRSTHTYYNKKMHPYILLRYLVIIAHIPLKKDQPAPSMIASSRHHFHHHLALCQKPSSAEDKFQPPSEPAACHTCTLTGATGAAQGWHTVIKMRIAITSLHSSSQV